jgi:sarcosine oxidase subunit gamma
VTVNLEFAKSPLGGAKHGGIDKAVLLQEVPFTPGFDLRVDPDSAAFLSVVAALGLVLPTKVGEVARNNADCIVAEGEQPSPNGISALTLGPDWWYLTGTADIAALLAPVQAANHISLVDVSSQRTKIEIYGPRAQDVLAHYWEQDLRYEHFPIDACSQGVLAKAPLIMWHCCENCYLLFPRASFAKHLWTALTDATVEYL